MSIVLEQLTKRYDGHPVVNNVSLEITDGEFFVLLGSSGSGKTTILSLIAGLTEVDHGRVLLHGRDVTHLPTQQRKVGFVFQNYALFQYMTVGENIEFGLSIRKTAAAERHRRRDELLELVGLTGLANRMPRQISGGQQQRVALARALAHRPDVLLLDEPLGALDAKIRAELRRTLKTIQRKLGIATILVTHDQEEAFDMADRIGVMSFGRLLEVGSPEELYQRPQTEFVSTFLGTANLMVGQVKGGAVQLGPHQFPLAAESQQIGVERRVQVLFRPEDVALAATPEELGCSPLGVAQVEETTFGGSFERLRLRLPRIQGVRPIAPPVPFGSDSIVVDASRSPGEALNLPLAPGEQAWLGVRRIHTLAHPGLSFLIVTDGSLRAGPAIELGGQIARLAHARVTLLGCAQRPESLEPHLQEARKQLGSGLASLEVLNMPDPIPRAVTRTVRQNPFDLVIMGFSAQSDVLLAEQVLSAGEHHLLLAPCPHPTPTQALICVAYGEPGKEDVLFAGRLVRHLGADATLLSVLSGAQRDAEQRSKAQHFLDGGVQSLNLLGVPARSALVEGVLQEKIVSEMRGGGFDMLILGAPLGSQTGSVSLSGVVTQLLTTINDHPALIVRSHYIGAKSYPSVIGEQGYKVEEVIRDV